MTFLKPILSPEGVCWPAEECSRRTVRTRKAFTKCLLFITVPGLCKTSFTKLFYALSVPSTLSTPDTPEHCPLKPSQTTCNIMRTPPSKHVYLKVLLSAEKGWGAQYYDDCLASAEFKVPFPVPK